MTIKDLIKGKDYEYIARVNVLPNGQRDVVEILLKNIMISFANCIMVKSIY